MDNLQSLLNLSSIDTIDLRITIIDAVKITTIEKYTDHNLLREPWTVYHEFHVLNDLLVIYYQVDVKERLRLATSTNHKKFSTYNL